MTEIKNQNLGRISKYIQTNDPNALFNFFNTSTSPFGVAEESDLLKNIVRKALSEWANEIKSFYAANIPDLYEEFNETLNDWYDDINTQLTKSSFVFELFYNTNLETTIMSQNGTGSQWECAFDWIQKQKEIVLDTIKYSITQHDKSSYAYETQVQLVKLLSLDPLDTWFANPLLYGRLKALDNFVKEKVTRHIDVLKNMNTILSQGNRTPAEQTEMKHQIAHDALSLFFANGNAEVKHANETYTNISNKLDTNAALLGGAIGLSKKNNEKVAETQPKTNSTNTDSLASSILYRKW